MKSKETFKDYLAIRVQEDLKAKFEEKCRKNSIVPSALVRGLVALYNIGNEFYVQSAYLSSLYSGALKPAQYRIATNVKQRFLRNCKKNKTTYTKVIRDWMQRFVMDDQFAGKVIPMFKTDSDEDDAGGLDERLLIHIESGLKEKFFQKCPENKSAGSLIRTLINYFMDDKGLFVKEPKLDLLMTSNVKDDQLLICISPEKKRRFLRKCGKSHYKPSMIIRLGIQYYIENGTFD